MQVSWKCLYLYTRNTVGVLVVPKPCPLPYSKVVAPVDVLALCVSAHPFFIDGSGVYICKTETKISDLFTVNIYTECKNKSIQLYREK